MSAPSGQWGRRSAVRRYARGAFGHPVTSRRSPPCTGCRWMQQNVNLSFRVGGHHAIQNMARRRARARKSARLDRRGDAHDVDARRRTSTRNSTSSTPIIMRWTPSCDSCAQTSICPAFSSGTIFSTSRASEHRNTASVWPSSVKATSPPLRNCARWRGRTTSRFAAFRAATRGLLGDIRPAVRLDGHREDLSERPLSAYRGRPAA